MSYISPAVFANASATGAVPMTVALSKVTPTSEDWERYQPLIKHLYVDEKKTLKEVAAIMAQQGHHATPRMYKHRIKKWKLDKNNKESDMLAIRRKKVERDAAGKQTTIRVRGQTITMEQVDHYFKRKGTQTQTQEAYDAPTPLDVSCRTPSPAPPDGDLSLAPTNARVVTEQTGMEWSPAMAIAKDEDIQQLTRNEICSRRSNSSIISPSLSLPRALLVPERLFTTVKTFIDVYLGGKVLVTNEDGSISTIIPIRGTQDSTSGDLWCCCTAAISLVEKGFAVQCRRALSKAIICVEKLVQNEHPGSLEGILDIFLFLRQRGHPEIVEIFRRIIFDAVKLHTGHRPWQHIWQLVAMLEEESLDETIQRSWSCAFHNFERNLGPLHPFTIAMKLNFIHHMLVSSAGAVEAEAILWNLLKQLEEASMTSNPLISNIVVRLMYNFSFQGRYSEAENLGLDHLAQAQEQGWYAEQILILDAIAHTQLSQGKIVLAENNLRQALNMIIERGGMTHPWAVDIMIELESWLRSWGGTEEADELQLRIEEAIGEDDIDKELGGQ
ncbi:hypothetical protein EG329_013458 [Mollisiaceae sp. DMI_Dod_QoI]|nr:hypothetical protein EG329_013458 [Helotiales sp. DMI_Dod_QoI]